MAHNYLYYSANRHTNNALVSTYVCSKCQSVLMLLGEGDASDPARDNSPCPQDRNPGPVPLPVPAWGHPFIDF
jgi:hypothetical protein